MELIVKSDLEDFSKLNVLVIDDNLLVHDVIKSAFKELGIKSVKTAENAYYALRLCEKQRFHVVICSFNVKSDKDGFHLLEELKFKQHVTKSTCLIFLSAETSESLVNSIIELEPDDFWVKPLTAKHVQERLLQTLKVKKKLFSIYQAIDRRDFSKAIYFADRFLLDKSFSPFRASLVRMKGESLLSLHEYKEAELYYGNIRSEFNFGWVDIGYVKSLLKQDKIDEIKYLLSELKDKAETRFATHDLLAHYHIGQGDFATAYQEIQKAAELAPRNIERNKKAWDLARLNHDHHGQFVATRNIVKQAKNSIHDSPQLLLNVIRAGIDYASTITDDSAVSLLKQVDRYIHQLENDYGDIESFKQQVLVVKSRLHNVRGEKHLAERVVDAHVTLKPTTFIEDNLDKVKVFHELGMREEALSMLEVIKKQITGESLAGAVVNKYIDQEIEERQDVHFTVNELHNMAIEFYKKNKMNQALDSLLKAFRLAPKNTKIMLNLLKVLIVLKQQGEIQADHMGVAAQLFEVLENQSLNDKNLALFEQLQGKWLDEAVVKG